MNKAHRMATDNKNKTTNQVTSSLHLVSKMDSQTTSQTRAWSVWARSRKRMPHWQTSSSCRRIKISQDRTWPRCQSIWWRFSAASLNLMSKTTSSRLMACKPRPSHRKTSARFCRGLAATSRTKSNLRGQFSTRGLVSKSKRICWTD